MKGTAGLLHEALADMEELKSALEMSESPRVQAFLAALEEPRNRDCCVRSLAAKYGIRSGDIVQMWSAYQAWRGKAIVMRGIPDLVREMMEDAKPVRVGCPSCGGSGEVAGRKGPKECPQCQGAGAVRKPGDPYARKWALEISGLTPKHAVIVEAALGGSRGSLERILDEVEALEREPRAIEAEFEKT
jgi:hypothetical protein